MPLTQQNPASARQASALKRFGRYNAETENIVSLPYVKEDRALSRLIEIFRESCGFTFGMALDRTLLDSDDTWYAAALRAVSRFECDHACIEKFSLLLPAFEGFVAPKDHHNFPEMAGLFLSALINHDEGLELEFIIRPGVPLDFLGYQNIKDIVIHGNAGGNLGCKMICGTIHLMGDTGVNPGNYMGGGRITVNGNVIATVGALNGGELHVNSENEFLVLHPIEKGKIFHNGKLILDK